MKKSSIPALALYTMLIASTAFAQVPVQWSRTLQLEGYWEGPVTLNLGGQIFNLTYYMDFKTAVDGNAMTMDEGFNDPALGELKGANLIGLNAADGLIHWFSADNFGTAHEHTGSWTTPKHFYMEHRGLQSGLEFVEMIDARLRANDQRFVVSLVATLGGDTVQVLEGTLYRQSAIRAIPEKASAEELVIYPNPSEGKIVIESPTLISDVTVTSENGRLVYTSQPGEYDHEMKLETPGIFFVQVTAAGKTETKQIFISK